MQITRKCNVGYRDDYFQQDEYMNSAMLEIETPMDEYLPTDNNTEAELFEEFEGFSTNGLTTLADNYKTQLIEDQHAGENDQVVRSAYV